MNYSWLIQCLPSQKTVVRAFGLAVMTLLGTVAIARPLINVRVNRWLAVRQPQGTVTYWQRGQLRPVRPGDRLQAMGDGIITGKSSTTMLEVDTGIGFIQLAENTRVTVRSLGLAPDNGRITRLAIDYGQARLQIRRFTHEGSRLELQTPAGVSAVRGTKYGIVVQPDGKTGLATLEGAVTMTAQGKTVVVSGGLQTLTVPGQQPQNPVPLQDSTDLRYDLDRQIQNGIRRLRFIGYVDPVNHVLVDGVSQTTTPTGQFSVLLPAVSSITLQVTVITPLGRQQVHRLSLRL